MKRLSVLSLVATAAFAQTHATAPAAPAAPVAPAVAPATTVAASGIEAPYAPVSASLLQGNAAAPTGIEDVLLAPHASAGLKAVGFNWANANQSEAYILWNKLFAAAQVTPAAVGAKAETQASFGLMTPGYGAGVTLAFSDATTEDLQAVKKTNTYSFTQAKLFGSLPMFGGDLYGNLTWAKSDLGTTKYVSEKTDTTGWTATLPSVPVTEKKSDVITERYDSLMISAGLRKYPAANVEGLAWNVALGLGTQYARQPGSEADNNWLLNLDAQIGYIAIVDGVSFLPGAAVSWHHANSTGYEFNDYANTWDLTPSVAVIVPIVEHWTLKGGAAFTIEQTLNDGQTPGDPSTFDDHTTIQNTKGNFGVRYARDRWAAEAGVNNGFLNHGPYFISGSGSDLFYTLGFTLNLK